MPCYLSLPLRIYNLLPSFRSRVHVLHFSALRYSTSAVPIEMTTVNTTSRLAELRQRMKENAIDVYGIVTLLPIRHSFASS